MAEKSKTSGSTPISAVVATCSAKKQLAPAIGLMASDLFADGQDAMFTAWRHRLVQDDLALVAAQDLYSGRAIKRARGVADGLGVPLYVISAGLGLVAGATPIPSYDLTISPTAPRPIQKHVKGDFSHAAWWQSVLQGPYSRTMDELESSDGRILIALTQPYADLIGAALAHMPDHARCRLRIFGAGSGLRLPPDIVGQRINYGPQLDQLTPGTRLDAASRALAHFANLVKDVPCSSITNDQLLVDHALSAIAEPETSSRRRMGDAALKPFVDRLIHEGFTATKAIGELRKTYQVACEERRFRRLYLEASA